MGPPPAKKQKRLIVLNSEDEAQGSLCSSRSSHNVEVKATTGNKTLDDEPALASLTTRAKVKARGYTTRATSSRGSTPALSPQKPRPPVRKTTAKSGTLYSFFNTTTQSQQVNGCSEITKDSTRLEEEDLIQDVSSSDEHRRVPERRVDALGTQTKHQSLRPESLESLIRNGRPLEASQRFKPLAETPRHSFSRSVAAKTFERRPWAEMFVPSSIEELAVHKRKVVDVRTWLENVFNGQERKTLLILKGPSGAGKTATIAALAKSLGFDVVEWKNPAGSNFATEGYQSLSAQFEDFLEQGGKFNSLILESSGGLKTVKSAISSPEEHRHRKRVILLEEFPNTFSRTSSALLSFRANVAYYLAANTPSFGKPFTKEQDSREHLTPLVMIISETLLTTTTSAADSFTAHRLFGSDILSHPGTTVIEFNPIAPTILTKALDLILQKEARLSGRRRIPGPAVLKKLSETGDIRSAIGSLEFVCVSGDNDGDWGGRVAAKGKRGAKDSSGLSKMEQESLVMVTQREASLGIFHAVGKVIYNKREEVPASLPHSEPPTQPPDHLSHHARPKQPTVNVDELMDETGTDTPTFTAALHENYALSCDGPTSTDCINGCIEALSDSDLLSSDRRGGFSMREGLSNRIYGGSDAESLRQNEICFRVAVTGLLFALPYPVKRRIASTAADGRSTGKGAAYKMFYPASMRLWKQTEEMEDLIDRWTDPSMHSLGGQSSISRLVFRGAEMWRNTSSVATTSSPALVEPAELGALPLLIGGNSARREMILERLPYLAKIECRRPTSSRFRELEKMTQFHGVGDPTNDVLDEEDDDAARTPMVAEWATDRPSEDVPDHLQPRPRHNAQSLAKDQPVFSSTTIDETTMERLVLSDDDIEDD